MPNIFLISDTHFGHANILNFKGSNGDPIRSFSCVEEMDEHMIDQWNSVVRPQDKVYHLGDVAMDAKYIKLLDCCNGHKRLVLGNHDEKYMRLYAPYVEAVYSSRRLDGYLLTHIPVHPMSLGKAKANIHGHIHEKPTFGPEYFNVSVEAIAYTPIALEVLKKKL